MNHFERALVGNTAHGIKSVVHDPAASTLVLWLTDDFDSPNPTRKLEFVEVQSVDITWSERDDEAHEGLLGAHEDEMRGLRRYLLVTDQREITIITRQRARVAVLGAS